MVAIYVAYTQQINPAGVTPVLTRAQIWAALERKVRRAQDFVPVITECKVLEDKDNVVVREAKFITGQDGVPGQEGKTIREVCKLYEPTRVRIFVSPTRGEFRWWWWLGPELIWFFVLVRLISTSRMGRSLRTASVMDLG
jgi:hypothetical protein